VTDQLPPPAASALLDGPVTPATETSAARAAATAELDRILRDPATREQRVRGDGALENQIRQLQRTASTPTGVFIAGVETPAEVDQRVAGWTSFIGVGFADVYGPELGPKIEAEIRANTPITPAEYRQAKAAIEEMKHDSEFQAKLKANNVRCKARWSLAHNMTARPIVPDPK
jgi:hypothetical protein